MVLAGLMAADSRIIITVDGLAGSGKTALSRELAARLGYRHFSTGQLYRALGYLALKERVCPDNEDSVLKLLGQHEIKLIRTEDGGSAVAVDGHRLSEVELHQPQVSDATSKAAAHPAVRSALLQMQRCAFPGENLVAEGRDLGTVVFPDAAVKFFITADEEVRSARRLKQLSEGTDKLAADGDNLLKKQLKVEIDERDRRDASRKVAPAVPADDAIIIDNSRQPLTAVVQTMYDAVAKNGAL
ncbi:MAG: (d)CMP kinase [Candidatus Dadabacteria bacterium]|nr:MAG: (d)CMP kinase [Candidatus Dadabacteria bacterium]